MAAAAYQHLRPRPSPRTRLAVNISRLSSLLSSIVIFLIVSVHVGILYLYISTLRPLFTLTLPPTHASLLSALHTSVTFWLLFSTALHYFLAVTTAPGSPSQIIKPDTEAPLPPPLPPPLPAPPLYLPSSQTWRYCATCAAPKPPRAHHDSTTNSCALQMCHYCPAVGNVVGLRNYPHFFRFILHAFLGALFSTLSCFQTNTHLPPHLTPTFRGNAVFFTAAASAATAVAVFVLLAFHIYLLATGQTTIEFYENWAARHAGRTIVHPFDAGLPANIAASFGPPLAAALPWWSVLFLPDFRAPAAPAWMLQQIPIARPQSPRAKVFGEYCAMQLD